MADELSDLIDHLGDWRGDLLARISALVKDAVPGVAEEMKWKKKTNPFGVPAWSADGLLATGEPYKDKVKVTFARGASLDDPAGLFNASLDANVRRAIDIGEGDELDADAFADLVRAAAKLSGA